ncbi:DDE-type integrase/transposase/recombinase [Dasania marina]|uniref:DDE-type integrase/transposase/recombinase n=1 Tax=Dasania marina TaxID=471499 RepID=UPI0030DCACF2
MPWRELKPMDQKVLFIADFLRNTNGCFTSLCAKYGISRKTGYKWRDRYTDLGISGLTDQSRQPHSHPCATPYTLVKEIVRLREKPRITPGAKKIQAKLVEDHPDVTPPSVTTIYNILKREGLVKPRKVRHRVMPYNSPFKPVTLPNELWSVDFKGQFKLNNGQWCYPLTVMDHSSRYLLGCKGLKGTGGQCSQRVFRRIFKEYGLPSRIRSDNGVPFATKAAGGLSSLSIWWIKLGIHPERIKPGKPQ